MERARHRKTKSASGIEGIQQILKRKAIPRLSSDSGYYIDGSNRNDMFMLELAKSSLGGTIGTPMKKLLAEEMSKDVEPKRRSPSIIARLMGLEGLPSPRHVNRQQKRSSDSFQHIQKNRQIYDGRSNSRNSMNQQEFKDVYEDLEASHIANRRCFSRWSANSILTKPEMAMIEQKFIDAKHLSTDENLQVSKEVGDSLEMLDSSKDLLLKFLGQQDSLFVKHLHDLQVDPGSSLGSHIAVLKPLNSAKYESKAKTWRSGKDNSTKPHFTSHLTREDGLLLESHNRNRAHVSCNSSRTQVEKKNEEKMLPTRIVVLKPNLGKMQNAGTSCSSPGLSHGHLYSLNKISKYPSVGGTETMSWRRKDTPHNVGLSKVMSKEARETAREITRKMRDGYDETMDTMSTGYKGYVGDESSYDANESNSESESEVFKLSPRRSIDGSILWRYPSSRMRESSVNKEAKKRLSERWKRIHKYPDLEMISRSTLGEMLASPGKETRPNPLNAKKSLDRVSNRLGGNNGSAVLDGPSGISSRDGWKDEICRNSSRSRSLPPSTGGRRRSHRRNSYQVKLAEEKNLMLSETVLRGRNKVLKGTFSEKEDYSCKDTRSGSKKPRPCPHIFSNEIDSSSEANFEIKMEPNPKDLTEQQSTFQMPEKADTYEIPAVDVMMFSEPGSTTMSSRPFEMPQKLSPSTLDSDETAAHNQEDSSIQDLHKGSPAQGYSSLQCLGAELDSSESYKEAGHPSPISVLEVPFTEDTSSSECFERVSSELHELRMQLHLLKLESGKYGEASTLLPIEEEVQLSPVVFEENCALVSDCWKTSYALDVLFDSGLGESDFNTFRTMCHSADCPLDPNLFDKLEKKYNDETSGLRSERRLFFDRINSALLEIFQEHAESCPWVMPKLAGLSRKWQRKGVEDTIEKLINQDTANREISDRGLDRELLWSDYNGEFEMLGNEIEKLLIDDMITEVVCN